MRRNSGPSLPGRVAAAIDCDSRDERSVWNHSNEPVSLHTHMNSTRRSRRGGFGELRRCQMFLRIEPHGVTPMPVPMRTAISLSKTCRSG